MIDIKKLTKRYYTIAEVGELFGVAKSLLRYWEGEFKEIQPKKDRNGIRRYTVKDIQSIERVYDLLKNRGFTIDGARKELASGKRKTPSKADREALKVRLTETLDRLKKIRNQLSEL